MSRLSSPVHEARCFGQPASGQHHRGAARATTSDRDYIAKTSTLTFAPVTKSEGKKGQTTLFCHWALQKNGSSADLMMSWR